MIIKREGKSRKKKEIRQVSGAPGPPVRQSGKELLEVLEQT
jgi:hypothetical protein